MGLDTKTRRLFLDTSDFGPAPAPTAARRNPQPVGVFGTFRALVYAPSSTQASPKPSLNYQHPKSPLIETW